MKKKAKAKLTAKPAVMSDRQLSVLPRDSGDGMDETVVSLDQVGRPGTKKWGGFIAEDFNKDFNGQAAIEICDRMRKTDGAVTAVLRALKWPIMGSEWQVESPDSDDERMNEIAEFVRAELFDNLEGGFTQFLRESMSYLDFGFKYFEIVWEVEGSTVHLKRLASLQQTAHQRWTFKDGTERGITQQLPSRDVGDPGDLQTEIPWGKLLLFTNEREGDNYAGTPILRGAYKHYFMKDQFYRIDALKHERGAGFLKIRHPDNPKAKASADELGRNFTVNEQMYVALPGPPPKDGAPGWEVEIMTAGIGDQSAAMMESLKHHNRAIYETVLANFMDLGSGSTGSFALGDVQRGFFGIALKAITDYVSGQINETLIKKIVDLNFGEQEYYPMLNCVRTTDMEKSQLATALATLNTGGMIMKDAELMTWITKAFGLPEKTVEDFDKFLAKAEPIDPDKDPQGKNGTDPKGNGGGPDDGKFAACARHGRKELAGKARFAKGPGGRDLTIAEQRVQFADISDWADDLEEQARKDLDKLADDQMARLKANAEKIIDADDPRMIDDLEMTGDGSLESEFLASSVESFEKGKKSAAAEIGVTAPATKGYSRKVLASRISLFMKMRRDDITNATKARLLDILNGDMGKAAGLFEIEQVIADANAYATRQVMGQIVMRPLNEGRFLTFEDAKEQIHAMQRSEVLDENTCPTCITLDGKILNQSDPFTQLDEVHDNCFTPEMMVKTKDGEKPISEIKVGDVVATHMDNWRDVYHTIAKHYDGELMEIETEDGRTIRCTPDHKLWVGGQWVAAGDLVAGDELSLSEA